MKIRMISENHEIYRITTHSGEDYYWFEGQNLEDWYDPEISNKISELAESIYLDTRGVNIEMFVAKKSRNNTGNDIVAALWYDINGFHIAVDDDYQRRGIGSALVKFAMHDRDDEYLTMQVTNSWLANLLRTKYGMVPVRSGMIGKIGGWLTNDPDVK